MKFNPNEYETVKQRKERFYQDHEDGRIAVELINQDHLEYAYFKASVYLNQADQERNCPRGVGYALEIRDKDLSVSNSGSKYESVNFTSWTENCEESAVGRALDNAGYSGNKKPSRDEMQKAQRMANTVSKQKEPVFATDKQIGAINRAIKNGFLDKSIGQEIPNMTKSRASELVSMAIDKYNQSEQVKTEASEVDTY